MSAPPLPNEPPPLPNEPIPDQSINALGDDDEEYEEDEAGPSGSNGEPHTIKGQNGWEAVWAPDQNGKLYMCYAQWQLGIFGIQRRMK
jgi:hypothetical protein